jgi:hypothetical protein
VQTTKKSLFNRGRYMSVTVEYAQSAPALAWPWWGGWPNGWVALPWWEQHLKEAHVFG